MKKLSLDRTKLTAYSGMAAALLAVEKTDAQIVYTDISPNAILNNTQVPSGLSEMIDMNNDGKTDFEITSRIRYNATYSSNWFTITAKSKFKGNKIANSVGFQPCWCIPYANDYGDVIGSTHSYQMWRRSGTFFSELEDHQYWEHGQEHYLGVKFQFTDYSFHYGWVRLKVFDNYPVEIMDYAYNTIPDQSIIAGQTTPCSDPFESNNDFATAKRIQTGKIYHGLIDVATDVDFYWWTHIADTLNPNVQISLLNLPDNYNIKIYNSKETEIAVSKNGGLADERIFYNGTLPNGNYLIKVYPKNSLHFDPVNCYSLQIESRSTPYPRIAASKIPVAEITSINVFPNPAEDHITFLRTGGLISELRIMDVSGREVMTSDPGTEQASITIDISGLPAGAYFAQITGREDVIFTKFMVQK